MVVESACFHLFPMNAKSLFNFPLYFWSLIFVVAKKKIPITILWDIVEWRRIRSLNEMANNSGGDFSDPLHWFRWLLIKAPSPCPLIPLLLLLWTLLNILLPQAFRPAFALLRISSSHKCYCVHVQCFVRVCVSFWFVKVFFSHNPQQSEQIRFARVQ